MHYKERRKCKTKGCEDKEYSIKNNLCQKHFGLKIKDIKRLQRLEKRSMIKEEGDILTN